jgi:hypothetical protein
VKNWATKPKQVAKAAAHAYCPPSVPYDTTIRTGLFPRFMLNGGIIMRAITLCDWKALRLDYAKSASSNRSTLSLGITRLPGSQRRSGHDLGPP